MEEDALTPVLFNVPCNKYQYHEWLPDVWKGAGMDRLKNWLTHIWNGLGMDGRMEWLKDEQYREEFTKHNVWNNLWIHSTEIILIFDAELTVVMQGMQFFQQ